MTRCKLVWCGVAGLIAGLLAAGPAAAQAGALPATRGALLYETHCIACHSSQMHWRDQKVATDWTSLKRQVRRWQAEASLGWNDDDIDEVARHLNERFYRFEPAGARQLSALGR